MADGGLGQQGQGGIVEHHAAGGQHAAMAVAHVFAQADVGDDVEVWPAVLETAHGFLHDAVFGIRAGGLFILPRRDAEEDDGLEAVVHGLFHLFFQLAEGKLILAGHGRDLLAEGLVVRFHHEIGHDEIFGQQRGRVADHVADLRAAAQTAATMKERMRHGYTSMRELPRLVTECGPQARRQHSAKCRPRKALRAGLVQVGRPSRQRGQTACPSGAVSSGGAGQAKSLRK